MVDIGITNKCNNCCLMCTSIMPKRGEIDIQHIIKKIDETEDNQITLTGGEPTIRPELLKILNYIRIKFPSKNVQLITNSRMFTYESFCKELTKLNQVKISTELYGSTQELHESITRSKGSFNDAVTGINNLLKYGIKTELRAIVSGLSYKDLPDLIKLYKTKFSKCDKIVIIPIDFIGNAKLNIKKTKYTFTQIAPYLEKAIEIYPEKVSLYHTPYCVVKQECWKNIQENITVVEERVNLSEECLECRFNKNCPKIWKSYIHLNGVSEFKKV